MKFKNMILRSFLGPKSSPFQAKPKINFNVKTASFGSIQGLPMAASKTSVLGPSKIQICQKWFKIYEPQNHIFEFHLKNEDSQNHWEFPMK